MAISISKIKNIKATVKNWIENETRGLDIGSNPHSNGDFFSRSSFLCMLIMGIIIITNTKIIINKYI